MAVEEASTHRISTCMVEMSPGEVYAGTDMTLKGKVSCAHACDLRGQVLEVKDQDGLVMDRVVLSEFDGEFEFDGDTNATSEFVVRAPLKAGAYSWLAVFPAQEKVDILHEETSVPFAFTVRPHETRVALWGVPSAIAAGDRFSIKVGIKCSAVCQLMGKEFEIYNHEGVRVATGILGNDPWPGTSALYFAEVELEAPDAAGDYRWEARFPEMDSEIPHDGDAHPFDIKITSPPECLVTIEAIDKDKQTPIKGIHVLLHPYRAFTDERGVAEVRVAKGEYKLFLSGFNYIPFRTTVEITGDVSTKAELSWEAEIEHYDQHY